jgi:hypothetical protein
MNVVIIVVMILSSFFIGRLSVWPENKKFLKLKSELSDMTASRDNWREKYLVNVMRAKMKEMKEIPEID